MRRILAGLFLVVSVGLISGQATAPSTRPGTTRPATQPRNFAQLWERDIAAFEAADKVKMPPKDALLFVGSSTIVRWRTLQQDYPDVPIVNRGFGGNYICDSTHFADRIIFPYSPRIIFLRAGSNDLWDGRSQEEVFGDYKEFVAKVRSKLPEVDIVYMSISPTPSRWSQEGRERALNALIKEYAQSHPHLKYIDSWDMTLGTDGKPREELFVADRLHFSPAGYKVLIERVRPFIPKQ